MGIISLTNTEKLFWLGRYSERVYTTIRLFEEHFDRLIDANLTSYEEFCCDLDIPTIYLSGDDFVDRYLFDETDPNSVFSNLTRAYDNAVTLREEIGSEPISYIQLAIYVMKRSRGCQSPMIELQRVVDDILAFWGITDDMIPDENTRNIIKVGKRVERLDLYARLKRPPEDIQREVRRLVGRIDRTNLKYNAKKIARLQELAESPAGQYREIVSLVDGLVEI